MSTPSRAEVEAAFRAAVDVDQRDVRSQLLGAVVDDYTAHCVPRKAMTRAFQYKGSKRPPQLGEEAVGHAEGQNGTPTSSPSQVW